MNTARLYQKIISIIQQSFIEPAERFGLSVVELKELDPQKSVGHIALDTILKS
jgi:hypothetical protein